MALEKRVSLVGSERKPVAGAAVIGPVKSDETISVTVVFHRRHNAPAMTAPESRFQSREEYGVIHGADPAAFEMIEEFAHEHGLAVAERAPYVRSVRLTGTAEQMQSAFQANLQCYEVKSRGLVYRGREGAISIPEKLQGMVMAVLGLDNRPVAKPHFRSRAAQSGSDGSFTPVQLARLYDFPTNVNGAGQTIGIIELGGGYRKADLTAYFSGLNIKAPKVAAIAVGGAHNKPGGDADGEVMLDIEVAGAVAPGANIVVYFAHNTDQGFHDAVSQAAHDSVHKPSIISISWGGSEDSWTDQARTALNAALQDAAALAVTVTVAAGDDGATDGAADGKLHVDFPASSPFVLACGGTKVVASGATISHETVWNELASNEGATGGGVSGQFEVPAYQAAANVPVNPQTGKAGRGVPDIAGDADPVSGYQVRVDGKNQVIGGTSAVAPLWAGLFALVNQQIGKQVGFVNPVLYSLPANTLRQITSGNNNGYTAGPGWNACTGLGSPNGVALVKALQGTAAAKVS